MAADRRCAVLFRLAAASRLESKVPTRYTRGRNHCPRSAVCSPQWCAGHVRELFETGTRWAYSNHGFATLGQIVEDVGGLPLERYLRERVFTPLGMESSELVRSERVRPRLATGCELRSRGLGAVADREIATPGAGGVCSTMSDMARLSRRFWAAAPMSTAPCSHARRSPACSSPTTSPIPRIPGRGLGFFRDQIGGHRTVGHDGIWTGFRTDMVLAPDDGMGVLAFSNTGRFDPRGAPVPVANALVRHLLDLSADAARTDVLTWSDLCGVFSFGPGVLTDPQPRMALGAGVEVVVRRGHLMIRGQTPIPAVRRGLRLHPEGAGPYAFRIDLSALGTGTPAVVFSRDPGGAVTAMHVGLTPMSFQERPEARNPRRWVNGAVIAGAAAVIVRRRP
jgi:hypothetical protein